MSLVYILFSAECVIARPDPHARGGISESSSQRLRTPQATPPSRSVYRAGGVPVSAQNAMVDPAPLSQDLVGFPLTPFGAPAEEVP